jgi:hypothetical protein
MQLNHIYLQTYPLLRGPGTYQKKDNERGIIYPVWIETSSCSRGHKISTQDGKRDKFKARFKKIDHFLHGVLFSKTPKPSPPRARETLHPRSIPLVPSLKCGRSRDEVKKPPPSARVF